MATPVQMPALGESVSEGTVTRWLKQEGDTVAVDEPLLEVSTDKVDTEIPSPAAGVLQQILVREDETVEVGAQLAVIGDGAASDGQSGGDQAAGEQAPASQQATQEPQQPAQQEQPAAEQQPAAQQEDQAQQQPVQQDEPTAAPAEEAQQQPQQQEQPAPEQPTAGGSGEGTQVTMPALGESVTEGTVTRWLKQVGDTVAADEPLLEVSTDKVDTEIPSPAAGVLVSIAVNEDETVPVGAPLAVIGEQGAAPAGDAGGQAAPQPPAAQEEAQQPPQQEQQPPQEAAQPAAPQSGSLISAPTAAPQPAPQQPAPQQPAPQQLAPEQTAPQQAAPPAPPTQAEPAAPAAPAPAAAPAAPQAAAAEPPAAASGDAYVTPLVRKLAAEHKVDLATVTGTGVGGRIRKQDVLEAAKSAAAAPAPASPAAGGAPAVPAAAAVADARRGTTEKMSRMRRVIAERMVESLHVSAQLTTVVEVDVTKIARLRDRAKRDFEAREGVKLSFLPFFAKAAVEALKAHPKVNASINGDEIVYHGAEHLGVAVDTEKGLLVPVIRDAGDLNIAGLARKIADLAERTRNNKITPDELGGGTFTLTNTGSRGALFDTPIINQPQVGILGTGAVVKRPIVVDDADLGETIAVRSMVYLALSYDHRLVDGADAARFLLAVKQRLEDGAFEGELGL